MKAVLLFPGQGAQKVGMGHDFYETSETARKLMDRADAALGCSLTKVMFEGPETYAHLQLPAGALPTWACHLGVAQGTGGH